MRELRGIAGLADSRGYQVAMHAIGDKAIDVAIDALRGLRGRHGIEHCSVVNDQLGKIRGSGAACVVQPHFVVTDFWAGHRLGSSGSSFVYRFRDLIDVGIPPGIPNRWRGSVGSVAHVSSGGGQGKSGPVAGCEALHRYTEAPAVIINENGLGSLAVGNKAGVMVINGDPLRIEPEKLGGVKRPVAMNGGYKSNGSRP